MSISSFTKTCFRGPGLSRFYFWFFAILLFSGLAGPWSYAQDFTHLHLDLQLDTLQEEVSGTVTHRITDLQGGDSLFVNGIRMRYQEVLWEGRPLDYRALDTGLRVRVPDTVLPRDTIRYQISYRCHPRKGIYFTGWQDSTFRARRQIWTQGQGIDHRHWIPHHDDQRDKVLLSLQVHFASGYQVMSNGRRTAAYDTSGGRRVWRYQMQRPMSSYLLALVIGRYDTTRTYSASGVPLTQYYYPDRAEDYDWYYRHNERIFNFLERNIGLPYPWGQYRQAPVRNFRHGAMENTTATIFGDFMLVDSIAFQDRNYTYMNAHELAHQWHGNMVTAAGSAHHWLHEGFATYYQWRSEAELYGSDQALWNRQEAAQQVLAASQQDSFPLGHPQAGSARFYQKGAWVLHMLEQKLGTDLLDSAFRRYLRRYAYGIVTTDSLRLVLEQTCQCELEPFFDQWVHSAGEPVLRAQDRSTGGQLRLSLQKQGAARLRLPIITYRDSLALDTTWWEGPGGQMSSQLSLSPASKQETGTHYWKIGQLEHWLLRSQVEKPLRMWKAQYRHSSSLLDRYRAVEAVENHTGPEAQQFLLEVLARKDEHHAPRGEALRLLLQRSKEPKQAQPWLILALRSGSVELQKTALSLVQEPGEELRALLADLRREGRSYELRKRAIEVSVDPSNMKVNAWLEDPYWAEHPGFPGHKVHVVTLAYRTALFQDRQALTELLDYSSGSYDFLTRINALEMLQALQTMPQRGIAHLFDALQSPHWQLRSAARKTFQAVYKGPVKSWLQEYFQEHHKAWPEYQQRRAQRVLDQLEES